MEAPYWHWHNGDTTDNDLRIARAQLWAYDEGNWRKIHIAANIPWGALQDWAVEQAARARKTVKLVVLEPSDSNGQPQFFDIFPAFCMN